MADPAPGRRDRHKARTREQIRTAARELFAERGFAGTTVAAIAERADVAERTFFRYFESKEDLLLPDLQSLFAAITQDVRVRLASRPPLAAVEAAVLHVSATHPAVGAAPVGTRDGPPGTATAGLRIVRAFTVWEEELVAALREHVADVPDPEGAVWARTVGMVCVGAVRAAWRTTGGMQAGEEAFARVLGETFALVRDGCPIPPSR